MSGWVLIGPPEATRQDGALLGHGMSELKHLFFIDLDPGKSFACGLALLRRRT